MKHAIYFILLWVLAGCYEAKQIFWLNPDGSGKVAMDLVYQPFSLGADKNSPEAARKSAVKDFLTKSKGVEAWSDVTVSSQDDGRIRIKATAFFPDLSALKLQQGNMISVRFFQGDKGRMVLELKGDSQKKSKKKEPAGVLSGEEKAKAIAKAKGEFKQAQGMLVMFLANLKHEAQFNLPGTVEQSMNFSRLEGGKLGIALDGKKLLAVMDGLTQNDGYFEKQISGGDDDPFSDEGFNLALFGEKGPVRATVSGQLKPTFDYGAELNRAKENQDTMFRLLGITEPPAPSMASSTGALRNARIAGVQWVSEASSESEISVFSQGAPGYRVCILIPFDGAVIEVDNARLTSAETEAGQDLLMDEEYERKASFPGLSKDRTLATCEFKLKVPAAGSKNLKSFNGEIDAKVAAKNTKVELGFSSLKEGSKGKVLGAEIKSIKASTWMEGKMEIEMGFAVARAKVKDVRLLDPSGKVVDSELGSSGGGDDGCEITLRVNGKVPVNGKIQLTLWDDLKVVTIPFSTAPSTLFGVPLP